MSHDLRTAVEIARAGARLVSQGFGGSEVPEMKGAVDPVTATDRKAEEAMIEVIRRHFPADAVLAEESGGSPWDHDRVWILDPLDGTVNFVHGYPHVSVSVGLWERGRAVAAVVVDPLRREELVASRGEGTSLNGEPVKVSNRPLDHALLATGFPYDRRLHAASYLATVEVALTRAQGIRRTGSAALDLAWVACGRLDGYWEHSIAPWDAAAGALLVTEAGGVVSSSTGAAHRLDDSTIVAAGPALHPELLAMVAESKPEHLA